jgi:YidC/Oxa1 family membrane protein insertase
MDWQKNILIVAMLAISLLLAIRYKEFSDTHTPISSTNTSSANSSSVAASINNIESTQATERISDNTNQAVTSRLIDIKTDSLLVKIDTKGGDIVSVSLPRHYAKLNTPEEPFVLLDNRDSHIYIAQSGLVGINGTDSTAGRPIFSSAETSYELKTNDQQLIVDLTLQQDQVKITKRFTFTRGEYLINVEYLIQNQSSNTWSAKLFGRIIRDNKSFTKVSALEMNPFLGAATSTIEENYKKLTFDDIAKEPLSFNRQAGWVSLVQHYFISAWIPSAESQNQYTIQKIKDTELYSLGFETQDLLVAAGEDGKIKASFYAGPKDTDKLKAIAPNLNLTVDYGWLWWIAIPLFWLLQKIHFFVGNWGLAIIGLTLFVKIIFYKLSEASYVSMAKMKKLQPKLAELKERYGDDRQRFSQEMMKLYKTEKVNPFGGCLPLLIQMPVFIALYWVLMESVELRHSPFYLWIDDLSRMDPYFVLPVLYGISQFITMKFSPQPPDPMQAKIMQMLPFVFTFMFLWFPSGLVLYWLTNNILQIIQQQIITRKIEKADAKA